MEKVIALPVVLMLAMFALFGVTWLFHHHHFRPFAGMFLLVIGLGFFWMLHSKEREESYRADILDQPSKIASSRPVSLPAESQPPTPDPRPLTPDKRPDWVDRPPHFEPRDNGDRVDVIAVASGRYATHAECDRAIIGAINEAVAQYIAEYVSPDAGPSIVFDPDYIRSQLVKEWYWETVSASVGQMNQLHACLVIDRHVRDELDGRVRATLVGERLKYTAAGTAVALLLLGGVYSILNRGVRTRAQA